MQATPFQAKFSFSRQRPRGADGLAGWLKLMALRSAEMTSPEGKFSFHCLRREADRLLIVDRLRMSV